MSKDLKNIILIALIGLFLCGFSLWGILKPADSVSVSERRPLAALPAAGVDAVLSGDFMTDFEHYALDQFPLRDRFRTVKACASLYLLGLKDNNGIYIRNGHASRLDYPLNADAVSYAASRFRFIYDRYLAGRDMDIYLSVIPDKNYFMARDDHYPAMDDEALLTQLRGQTDFARFIDIFPLLELSDYYATDPHWRQEKIVDLAQYLAGEMGVQLSASYAVTPVDQPFYGAYYGQSALPLAPDTLYYLDSPVLKDCRVYDAETGTYIPVYNLEKAKENDPYELFLSGPKSLLTIENPKAKTDRSLIIFRDSFGSSIAPLLAEGYKEITLVDIRYLSPDLLGRFIDFTDQDVLFLYSVSVLNNSEAIK